MRRVPKHPKEEVKPEEPPPPIIDLEIRDPNENNAALQGDSALTIQIGNTGQDGATGGEVKRSEASGDPTLKAAMAKLFAILGDPKKSKEDEKKKGKGKKKEKHSKKKQESQEGAEKPAEESTLILEIMKKGLLIIWN